MLLRTVILLIFTAAPILQAQHDAFIGKTKQEVQAIVKTDYREFGLDNSIVRQQFNYIKYVNASQSITWIIYFNEADVCRSTKMVCDYIEYDEMQKALDARFERTGDMQWEYTSGEDTIEVVMKEEDWYFTVREQRRQ